MTPATMQRKPELGKRDVPYDCKMSIIRSWLALWWQGIALYVLCSLLALSFISRVPYQIVAQSTIDNRQRWRRKPVCVGEEEYKSTATSANMPEYTFNCTVVSI